MASAIHLGDAPPIYKIDLALPPAERYVHVAKLYRDQLISITSLFDDLIEGISPSISTQWVKRLARLFLRRLYTHEETEEIRGISRATGIEMYLLVSLNVLLDLLMGCTSGAALAKDTAGEDDKPRLLHFRTLDWGMDALRKLLVRFEFVRGPDYTTVLATNITYIGFVGVLTGVRKGLSVSLNFRPNHDTSNWFNNYRFYGSHLLVLLGVRQSISSLLRQYIIPSDRPKAKQSSLLPLSKIWPVVMRTPSTAAYLIFCDGVEAFVLEKDHRKASMNSSSSFIVATNSDHITPTLPKDADDHTELFGAMLGTGEAITLTDFVEDSIERRACMQSHWDKKVEHARRASRSRENTLLAARRDPLRRTRSSQKHGNPSTTPHAPTSSQISTSDTYPEPQVTATSEEIIEWTAKYPTTNEMTHFAAVMDPTEGSVIWIRRYPDPLPFDETEWD